MADNDFNSPDALAETGPSINDAVRNMPDFDMGQDLAEPSPMQTSTQPRQAPRQQQQTADVVPLRVQNREGDGKFAEGHKLIRGHNEDPSRAAADAAAAAVEGQEAEQQQPVQEDFTSMTLEFAPEEEGGKPKTVTGKDLIEAYQKAEMYRREAEEARRIQPPPIQWDNQMLETVKVRGSLITQLRTFETAMQPDEPDTELINEGSPKYNPAQYHQQLTAYRYAMQKLQQVHQQRQMLEQQQSQEEAALMEARKMREQAKLLEFWPEIRDANTSRLVREDAARYYGITADDFNATYDSRMFRILKDALAHRQSLNQRQAAVKVVRGVPKLMKPAARQTSNTQSQTNYSNGMQRLAQSGRPEDAVAAIGAIPGMNF